MSSSPAPEQGRDSAALRATIRADLETTRHHFHALLTTLSEDDWRRHGGDTVWSIGELVAHLTISLERVPAQVARARRGQGMLNGPPVLLHAFNVLQARRGAASEDLHRIGRRYDAAHASVLATLEDVRDDEWAKGASFFHRYQTVTAILRRPVSHFEEHAAHIWAARSAR